MECSGKLREIYHGNLVHGEQKRVEGGYTLNFPKRNTFYFVLWLLRNGHYELEGYNEEIVGQQGKVKQKVQPAYNFLKRRFGTNTAPPRISITADTISHFLDMKIGHRKYHVLILLDITKNPHYFGTTNPLEFSRWKIELEGIMQHMKKKSRRNLSEIAEEDILGHRQMRHGNRPLSTCIELPPSRRSTSTAEVIPTDITFEIGNEGEEDTCDDHKATAGSESRIKVVASIRMKRKDTRDSSGEVTYEFTETKESAYMNTPQTTKIVQERSSTLPHPMSSNQGHDDDEPRPQLPPKKGNSSHVQLTPDPVDRQLTRHQTPPPVANKPKRTQLQTVRSANLEPGHESTLKDEKAIAETRPAPCKSLGRPTTQHKEPPTSRPMSVTRIPPPITDKPVGLLDQATSRKPEPGSIYKSLPLHRETSLSCVYENLPQRTSITEFRDVLPSTCTKIDDLKKDQTTGAAGIVLEFQRADLLEAMLLVAVENEVWCVPSTDIRFAGWRKEMREPLRSKLHVGDRVFRINTQIVVRPQWAEECIRTSAQNEIHVHINRLPRAKILDLKRDSFTCSWGLEVHDNEITSVKTGPATIAGLTPMAPGTISNKCCNWIVTEISSKTVPIVRSGRNENLVKEEILALRTTLVMVVQPGDFIGKLAEAWSENGHSQFY